MRACAREGVLCLLASEGSVPTTALFSHREHEVAPCRESTAPFHVYIVVRGYINRGNSNN